MRNRSRAELWDDIAFRAGKWIFLAVVLALFPVILAGLSDVTRLDIAFHIEALFSRGELLLVVAAILGAALSELFTGGEQRFRTARLFVGCGSALVALVASAWFADIAAAQRDGADLDGHSIAIGSIWLFAFALISGLACVVVSVVSQEQT